MATCCVVLKHASRAHCNVKRNNACNMIITHIPVECDSCCLFIYEVMSATINSCCLYSQAAVLQHAVDFIVKLKYEKQRLAIDNDNLLRLLGIIPSSTSTSSVTSPPCVADSAALRHQLPLYAIDTSPSMTKDHQDDQCPQFKRARLHDYPASSSRSSSSSSVSSDEGVAEMSSGPDRPTGSLTTMIHVETGTQAVTASDTRQRLSAAVDRRRRRPERELVDCRSSLVGVGESSVKYVVDQLTEACGDNVWNCTTKTASLDLEPRSNRCLVIKQVRLDWLNIYIYIYILAGLLLMAQL